MLDRRALAQIGEGAEFDTIIDVRSPAEFEADHLPGAINLPVLDDAQRAQVGTLYKASPFDARKLGASMVAANAARHIVGSLADKGGGWRPLIYCWRGGMRSGSFATILDQVGWRVTLVEGGYKAWRRLVVDRVAERPLTAPVWVLDGDTSSGKTAILAALSRRGVQVIDLEALANHRGSLFGTMPGGQPSQALFEGRLALALEAVDPRRPLVVEAESSRVGAISLPKTIWDVVKAAPRIRIDVPLDERARFTADQYREITDAPGEVDRIVASLSGLHSGERIAAWRDMAARAAWQPLAAGLMADHYDPRYAKHRGRYAEREVASLDVPVLDAAGIDVAAAAIESQLTPLAAVTQKTP